MDVSVKDSMAATKEDISNWFDKGIQNNATHMIVVCDTYDYDDYPVYVEDGENPHEVAKKYDSCNMQRVMEVYSLKKPKQPQLDMLRVWNWD
jgi:hypothetical protein